MGKLPNSRLHNVFSKFLDVREPSELNNAFSDWHYKECAAHAALTDLDVVFVRCLDRVEAVQRLWAALDPAKGWVTAILDLKGPRDTVTNAEVMAYKRLEGVGFPCYLAYWHQPEGLFNIIRPSTGLQAWLTEQEFKEWRSLHSPYSYLVQRAMAQVAQVRSRKAIDKLHEVLGC